MPVYNFDREQTAKQVSHMLGTEVADRRLAQRTSTETSELTKVSATKGAPYDMLVLFGPVTEEQYRYVMHLWYHLRRGDRLPADFPKAT